MKKTAILLCTLLGLPLLANAGVSVNFSTPGVSMQIGDQDHRGYYWDGYDWRTPNWWKEHKGRHVGMHGSRGYWNGHGWQPKAPAHNRPQPHQQRAPQHDNRGNHNVSERKTYGEDHRGGDNRGGNNHGGNNHDGNEHQPGPSQH